MTGSQRSLLALAVVAAALCPAGAAQAGEVLRVDRSGNAAKIDDPFVPSRAEGDLGKVPRIRTSTPRAGASAKKIGKKGPTRGQKAVSRALDSALKRRSISRSKYKRYKRQYALARSRRAKLRGQRARELQSVIATVEAIALRRELTASRMAPVFLILQRNTEFWRRSPFPHSRGYVQFPGSQMLFEYYVGEGLQLQPLANFKKANALHGACVKDTGVACDKGALTKLLREMVATRVSRGRFKAYEYYFDFGGGKPPWISGMATATGIQAFGRTSQILRQGKWRKYAAETFRAFDTPAPTGVATRGPLGGTHYLQYSFARRLFVINAFLQSVIGLYDYADITGDPRAARLWRRAEPEARAELPRNDTGDWSTYSYRGRESTREYYDLLLEFSAGLCHRLHTDVYCNTTRNFRDYISKPADLQLVGPATATKGEETQVR
ncbi:MAG: D-glucuronyl C5-epimerase family protein, partial [Thermoleophilaceae bacterium]